MLFLIPVAIWNQQHDWITVTHVSESTQAGSSWKPTVRYLNDFFFSEFGLLNPFFFVAAWVAGFGIWLRKQRDQREVYLFCMGAPLFLFLLFYSLKARILPNWIAPSIVPLMTMTVMYWARGWNSRPWWIRYWAGTGVVFGLLIVTVLHNTDLILDNTNVVNLIERTTRKKIVEIDPLRRVRAWEATAQEVARARESLQAEGKPVFVIGHHYGVTSQLSFYMQDSKAALQNDSRLVYFLSSDKPHNQFFFWTGYRDRQGQNAIYVVDYGPKNPQLVAPPQVLLDEFESVTDLGMQFISYEGRDLRPIQLFVCRGLR
jgi:hypothetical protein